MCARMGITIEQLLQQPSGEYLFGEFPPGVNAKPRGRRASRWCFLAACAYYRLAVSNITSCLTSAMLLVARLLSAGRVSGGTIRTRSCLRVRIWASSGTVERILGYFHKHSRTFTCGTVVEAVLSHYSTQHSTERTRRRVLGRRNPSRYRVQQAVWS